MKNLVLFAVMFVLSTSAYAQTKDEINVVATTKAFLTDKDESNVFSLIGANFLYYTDSSVVNSSALTTLPRLKKAYLRMEIALKLPMKFVVTQNTATLFCITEQYRDTQKEPEARFANTLFFQKENNKWYVVLWQQSPYKNDYSKLEWGN